MSLVLSRYPGQSILAGSVIVTLMEIRGGRARLAFSADTEVPIHRWEIVSDTVSRLLQSKHLSPGERSALKAALPLIQNPQASDHDPNLLSSPEMIELRFGTLGEEVDDWWHGLIERLHAAHVDNPDDEAIAHALDVIEQSILPDATFDSEAMSQALSHPRVAPIVWSTEVPALV